MFLVLPEVVPMREALQQVIAEEALQFCDVAIGVGRQDHLEGRRGAAQKLLFRKLPVGLLQRRETMPLGDVGAASRIDRDDVG